MSSKLAFTAKQNELMSIFKHDKLHRLNLLEGSVSSGKTWISLILWACWVATRPTDYMYMMCAKSLQTLKRNCLLPLQDLFGDQRFSFSLSTKEGRLYGRRIMLEGANDARSESKIRGITLGGAYCDELTLFPKEFFEMLLSRLRVEGAKLIATTNPDNPKHWVKTDFIDNAKADMLTIKFLIDDNTTLPAEYIRSIKNEYQGVFYQRFILGAWVAAEGAIYSIFANDPQRYQIGKTELPKFFSVNIGVDFGGNKSAHSFVCSAITENGTLIALASERHPATGISPSELNNLILSFYEKIVRLYGKPDALYADCAEQTLINGIRGMFRRFDLPVKNSIKRPILDRIRATTSLMSRNKFRYVAEECRTLEDALCSAVYDGNSQTDSRLDNGTSDIDTLDAFEYSFEKFLMRLTREEM